MHRIMGHRRLQLSSETIRLLRGGELGKVAGAASFEPSDILTQLDCQSADDSKTDIHTPPTTYGSDCKATTHP